MDHILRFIFKTILVLFKKITYISRIHVCLNFAIGFKLSIISHLSQCFSTYSCKIFCDILHSDFTETAAL